MGLMDYHGMTHLLNINTMDSGKALSTVPRILLDRAAIADSRVRDDTDATEVATECF